MHNCFSTVANQQSSFIFIYKSFSIKKTTISMTIQRHLIISFPIFLLEFYDNLNILLSSSYQ